MKFSINKEPDKYMAFEKKIQRKPWVLQTSLNS